MENRLWTGLPEEHLTYLNGGVTVLLLLIGYPAEHLTIYKNLTSANLLKYDRFR